MKSKSIITSSLIFGATGALFGLLLAPEKGKNTRDKISKKGKEYKDYMLGKNAEFMDSVSESYSEIEDKAKRIKNKVVE